MSNNVNLLVVEKLLEEASLSNLYPQLVWQLQKDLNRAGIEYNIDPDIKSNDLILALQDLLLDKLQHEFNEYLNLLYAVDVSEAMIKSCKSEKINDIACYATYLILKREWKKVWLRNNSNNSG